LSYFIPAPSAFADSYVYTKMARSFFYFLNFDMHGITTHHFPPLYPIILSIAYLFKDMQIVYLVMKILNAFLSSLIILPSWLIAKEFISEKKALISAILISLIPSNFSFTGYLMSENLFYPLFLFSIYFIYKSFTTLDLKYKFLAGLFIGLSFLTRNIGILLFGIVSLMVLFKFKKKNLWILMTGLIVILPWIIRNGLLFGFNLASLLSIKNATTTGNIFTPEGLLAFLAWILLYIGFLVLASGVLFPLSSFSFFKTALKNKKTQVLFLLFLLTIGLYILAFSRYNATIVLYETSFNWLTGRPLGRYIDVLLPLIFITGFIGFKFPLRINKIYLTLLALILAFSSQLIFFPLFPINNMSLVWLGLLTYVSKPLLLITLFFPPLPFILYYITKKLNRNFLIALFMLFFLSLSLINYGINYTNSKTYWYEGDQMQMGLWLNENIPRDLNILFDERDCTKIITKTNQGLCNPSLIPAGFWVNNNIQIGDVFNPQNANLIISKHNLNHPLFKEFKDVKIYILN
jgi:hypothetical protein